MKLKPRNNMQAPFKMKGGIKGAPKMDMTLNENLNKAVRRSMVKPKVAVKPKASLTLGRMTKAFGTTAKQYAKKGLSIASKLGKSANVASLVLGSTTTATADQPKGKQKKKGSYTDDFTKLRK